ncbi:U7 snRNA-associated Sm-like protein LSm11, partial [Stomoxys calcitrans]|uniref:Sm domain-containing protein n=1 Tax=Stomoxys calcitrans TaxID=35570 RepID=A0A1I8PMM7_STOCA
IESNTVRKDEFPRTSENISTADQLQGTKTEGIDAKSTEQELDIASDNFNPLRCLYASEYRVTEKHPKVIYQNMAAFETALKNVGIWDVGKKAKSQKDQQLAGPSNSNKKATLIEEAKTQRRFQEHQLAVRTQPKIKSKHTRNLLGQMADATGPLKALNAYVVTGSRVHVVVRKEKGIKGYIEGTLLMFDRHWNLLLANVLECYSHRKHKYAQDNIVLPKETYDCTSSLRQLGIQMPKQTIKSLNRKTIQIQRQLPQIFLRGEQVVLVYPARE